MFGLNVLVMAYVGITTLVILLSTEKIKHQGIWLVLNGCILFWEAWPFFKSVDSEWLNGLFAWSPLLLLPIFHRQTELLTTAFAKPTYDAQLIHIEKRCFPLIMNFHRDNRANNKLFSEFLHGCYLSFYLLIYGVPLYFYSGHDLDQFYESVFAILLLLFSCYITHGIIPVSGPRTLFKKIKDHRSHGVCFRLVHRLLESGSTHGTAFPSGHTGVAFVVLLITWHLQTPLFYVLLPFSIGLIISTIYGRFHYVLDMIAGILYAIFAFAITVWIYQ